MGASPPTKSLTLPWEWTIAIRYLMSKRATRGPSVIMVLSVLGVAVGVAALIVVLSVMGGFEGDLRNKILGTRAHVLVTGPSEAPLTDGAETLAWVRALEGVSGAAGFVESEVMLSSATNYSGVVLRGIETQHVGDTSDLPTQIVSGRLRWLQSPDDARSRPTLDEASSREERMASLNERLEALEGALQDASNNAEPERQPAAQTAAPALAAPRRAAALAPPTRREAAEPQADPDPSSEQAAPMPGFALPSNSPPHTPGIIVGTELQETLGVEVGDVVRLISPDGDMGPTGPIPRSRRYRIVAVFYSGLYEYDNSVAYVTQDDARRFLNLDANALTGVEARVDAPFEAAALRALTSGASGAPEPVQLRDWMTLNSNLFSALLLEKLIMSFVLGLIFIVAGFMIVSVLIMVVIEKRDEIAILKAMGATPGSVMRIFLIEGGVISGLGVAGGMALGLGIVGGLIVIGFPLDPEVFYIDRVPVEVNPAEILLIAGSAVAISLVATIVPSVLAAALHPADALRAE